MKNLYVPLILLFLAACGKSGYEKLSDGILVYPDVKVNKTTKAIKIQVVAENIIHVTASASDTFSTAKSIMVVDQERPAVKFDIIENPDTVILKTSRIKAFVSLKSGEVSFFDANNNKVLSEKKDGRMFEQVEMDSCNTFHVRQVFESTDDEAFYGLGQHQHGFMNLKGKDVDLTQFNAYISIPFLISSKNYGILWNNYSISKFGDYREYESLSSLKLYSKEGIEGGLTATYCSKDDPKKVFENRMESDLNYEYLKLQKKFPQEFDLAKGMVVWEGYLEAKEEGLQKILFNSAGYSKLWLNGTLVVDKWRQCWNPNKNQLVMDMEKGKRYPIKIEWIPDGGEAFISLKALSPYPAEEQKNLSLYSEAGDQIDYYFVYGNKTDEIISGYRNITGKATLLPKWAMGLWQSRERYKTQDELINVVKTFREKKIPFDNIVLDWQYWRIDQWGSHEFDSLRFPDPSGMIADLHNKYNSQIMISVWPKFYVGTKNYEAMNNNGWLYTQNVKNEQKDWIGYVSTFYDAFNPFARELFWSQINENLYKKGIDGWWLDATEPDILSNISVDDRKSLMKPTYVKSPSKYFNTFPVVNAQGIFEGQRKANPDKRVFILTRSAYAGLQRYAAASWSGDIGSRWEDLKLQIPAGLNFSVAGMPYWTTDIGGFAVEKRYENPSAADLIEWRELQTRWFQYGTFCPLFRVHGQFPYREMFNIAPENSIYYKSMVYYTQLRYRLMPYIYSLAGATYVNDYTIMRPLIMDFANDLNIRNIDNEFMFGPSMLICPVTNYKAESREVYLPASCGWYNLYTGKYLNGGQNITAEAPVSTIPVYIKEGSIIPVGPEIQYTTEKASDPVTLFVYTGLDGSFSLYEDENINNNFEKGMYTTIPFTYNEEAKSLTIGARDGSYQGMPEQRTFNIIWITKNKALKFDYNLPVSESITYTGKEVIIKMK